MNAKYFSFAYKLQYTVVFIGKLNLVTYQNLSSKQKINLAPSIWEINKKFKYKV